MVLAVTAPIIAVIMVFSAGVGSADSPPWVGVNTSYYMGTAALCGLVALGAGLIGTGTAIAVTFLNIPMRRFLSVGLVLPFALPGYIVAYAYGAFFAPFSAGGILLREAGIAGLDLKNLFGAGLILTLTTYPYVYLAVRASLAIRSGQLIEAATSLGTSPGRALRRVILPISRPAIAAGLALALMETIGDYGVADYSGVATLSTGIFKTWYGQGNLAAAGQLAGGLFAAAVVLLILEDATRRGATASGIRTRHSNQPERRIASVKMSSGAGAAVSLLCAIPVFLGFALPVLILLELVTSSGTISNFLAWSALTNTLIVSLTGAGIATIIGLLLALMKRGSRSASTGIALKAATAGYAMPGAMVAIGIVILESATSFGPLTNWITTLGISALIYAYVIRFLTAAFQSVDSGFQTVTRRIDEASKALGANATRTFWAIQVPLISPSIVAGGLIVAVDIMKELPATLLLRPFNFETIATRTYRLASDERLAEAAPEALLLIAVAAVPVLVLNRYTSR